MRQCCRLLCRRSIFRILISISLLSSWSLEVKYLKSVVRWSVFCEQPINQSRWNRWPVSIAIKRIVGKKSREKTVWQKISWSSRENLQLYIPSSWSALPTTTHCCYSIACFVCIKTPPLTKTEHRSIYIIRIIIYFPTLQPPCRTVVYFGPCLAKRSFFYKPQFLRKTGFWYVKVSRWEDQPRWDYIR